MDRLKKPKKFLEKLRLKDSDYQDEGMINHIADLLERYHTEQLILHGVRLSLPDAEYWFKLGWSTGTTNTLSDSRDILPSQEQYITTYYSKYLVEKEGNEA